MKRVAKQKPSKQLCELTTSTTKRAAADKLAASVQDAFPPGMSQPALRALASAGYTRMEQMTKIREADLLKLHGIGPKGVRVIRDALKQQGKSFRE